jgi:hypothetical protein
MPNCAEGFHCQAGSCMLNGNTGPLQVTLRWNTLEDLDLHLLEPLKVVGATCEIAFTDPNVWGSPSACGAIGSLDLDSEAGCSHDGVSIENIIYPPATAPCGTYTVWVNHWANCDPLLTAVPFELEARFGGVIVGMCGVFKPSDPDWNNHNTTQTRMMMQFTLP